MNRIATVAPAPTAVKYDAAPCPVCGLPRVEVWTMFSYVSCECPVCGWRALIRDTEALRPMWHGLIVRGLVRLRLAYGVVITPAASQDLFADANALTALDTVIDYLCRTTGNEAGEWAVIRGWLWDALAPVLVDVAESRAA